MGQHGQDFDEQIELSATEAKLVRRLERLASEWPTRKLMLASMGGSLCLFRVGDRFAENDLLGGLDQDKALWTSSAIPNTGGDW